MDLHPSGSGSVVGSSMVCQKSDLHTGTPLPILGGIFVQLSLIAQGVYLMS
jgi:hypothetical protein